MSKTVEEKKIAENQRNAGDEKWQSLKAYMRSKSLCFICGETQGREHQYKNTIQLHVVQELIEYMQTSEEVDNEPSEEDEVSPDPHPMMLSVAALNSDVSSPKSMQL